MARLLTYALLLSAVLAPAQTRDPLPVPDLPGYRTLKCDFHMHTVFSDGDVWPTTRVMEAWNDGLDVMAITDHSDYQPKKNDVNPDLRRPFEIAQPAARESGMLLVPGVEITKGNLHFNALFIRDPNVFGGVDLLTALRRAGEQHAYIFHNHPGWKGPSKWLPDFETAYKEKLFHGFEVANGRTSFEDAWPWAGEKQLAVFGNSDSHRPTGIQFAPRQRPVTLVFARAATLDGVREALDARRTVAWMGKDLWGPAEYLEGLWKASAVIGNPELALDKGVRSVHLHVRNLSAIPFRVRVTEKPEWLSLRTQEIEIRPEAITAIALAISPKAPAGRHQVHLQVEILNLHRAPGQNLIGTLPITIAIAPSTETDRAL